LRSASARMDRLARKPAPEIRAPQAGCSPARPKSGCKARYALCAALACPGAASNWPVPKHRRKSAIPAAQPYNGSTHTDSGQRSLPARATHSVLRQTDHHIGTVRPTPRWPARTFGTLKAPRCTRIPRIGAVEPRLVSRTTAGAPPGMPDIYRRP
jgi:hypothetical protein